MSLRLTKKAEKAFVMFLEPRGSDIAVERLDRGCSGSKSSSEATRNTVNKSSRVAGAAGSHPSGS